MASVYVSGDDSKSLVQYKDNTGGWAERDHSYYGLGCSNDWGTDGLGGSDVPCSTRLVKDGNDEDQKNGTYYHFQAATVGTGGAIASENANSPDTFCPLGWQLPYGGTGGDYYDKSKSWTYLLRTYSISFNDGTATDVTKFKSYPFSYIHSGYFHWNTGRLYRQTFNGHFWFSTNYNGGGAYRSYVSAQVIRLTQPDVKTNGSVIRCI